MIADEMSFAGIEIKVLGLVQSVFDAVVAAFYVPAHTFHDGGEVDPPELGRDAELFCLPDFNDSIRRIDEYLRGDSARVQTGAARWTPIHEGHGLVMGKRVLDQVRSGAGADDDDIVFFHQAAFPIR
jgi:hypothetical protein